MKPTIVVKTDYIHGYSCDQCCFAHANCPLYEGEPFCRFFDHDNVKYHFEQL